MSTRPSAGIGARLSEYRRLAGLSARELAEQCGLGLTRGVIANIESGRKTDVNVDQLLALSWALGISPVALALPVDEPYRFVAITDGHTATRLRAHAAVRWFEGDRSDELADAAEVTPTGATAMSDARVNTLQAYIDAKTARDWAETEPKVEPAVLDELRARTASLERELQRLQVDLSVYKIDE